MKSITFLGAAGTVTGSSFLLELENSNTVLVDLGMFQGDQSIEKLNRERLDINISKLSSVLLTHAHLDHCGRLPLLAQAGYRGPVYMTEATKDLVVLALEDSAKIASKSKHEEALYTLKDVASIAEQFKTVKYHEPFEVGGQKVEYHDAGHILGSASITIANDSRKIAFSGDLGNYPEPLVSPTEFIDKADIVLMESTYGDRVHPTENAEGVVLREINTVEDTGGTLLIPAFSLERTQVVLHFIEHFKRDNRVKGDTPVFLDSPMGIHATEAYRRYASVFNRHIREHSLKGDDPYSFPGIQVIRKHRESQKIKNYGGPKVIIAGSGMMTGGRILRHAIDFLPLDSTRLLIVGYQAEGTVGRQLQEGAAEIEAYGERVRVNATISEIHSMSAHADQPRLLEWLKHINGVQKLILIHGEDQARRALAKIVNEKAGMEDISLPQLHNKMELPPTP